MQEDSPGGLPYGWALHDDDIRYTQLDGHKRLTARVAKTTMAGYGERFSSQRSAWRRVRVNVHTVEWPFPVR